MLRFDDTDVQRTKDEYRGMITKDMSWLGLGHDGEIIKQSNRLDLYAAAKKKLIESGRIYECYETKEELDFQRKNQSANGQRPLYDRSSLHLTDEQKENYKKEGKTPHWRFLLNDQTTVWQDRIKGEIKFEGLHFSDPVIARDNNIPTYTFCSVVDDIEFGVTHIIRGEDHITNTAIQIQIFEALGASQMPIFSHLGLVKASEGKISKRLGGFDIKSLREEGLESLSIINLLSQIGISKSMVIENDLQNLINKFDIDSFSKSSTNYNLDELKNINHKLIQILPFSKVKDALEDLDLSEINENFWDGVKANINLISEIKDWWQICKTQLRHNHNVNDIEFLTLAKSKLPSSLDQNSWQEWIGKIKENSDRKGKELFMPLRLALTGQENGPELKSLLPLIEREEILARLTT
jgi:glutamyl-tRNA synthetase